MLNGGKNWDFGGSRTNLTYSSGDWIGISSALNPQQVECQIALVTGHLKKTSQTNMMHHVLSSDKGIGT